MLWLDGIWRGIYKLGKSINNTKNKAYKIEEKEKNILFNSIIQWNLEFPRLLLIMFFIIFWYCCCCCYCWCSTHVSFAHLFAFYFISFCFISFFYLTKNKKNNRFKLTSKSKQSIEQISLNFFLLFLRLGFSLCNLFLFYLACAFFLSLTFCHHIFAALGIWQFNFLNCINVWSMNG